MLDAAPEKEASEAKCYSQCREGDTLYETTATKSAFANLGTTLLARFGITSHGLFGYVFHVFSPFIKLFRCFAGCQQAKFNPLDQIVKHQRCIALYHVVSDKQFLKVIYVILFH
jgi:hypothetical protein